MDRQSCVTYYIVRWYEQSAEWLEKRSRGWKAFGEELQWRLSCGGASNAAGKTGWQKSKHFVCLWLTDENEIEKGVLHVAG